MSTVLLIGVYGQNVNQFESHKFIKRYLVLTTPSRGIAIEPPIVVRIKRK